jgi:hypothetical protein
MSDEIGVNTNSWHLEQYKMLRTEIMSHVEETRKLEIYAIGAISAIYSWFITKPTLPTRAWLIALLIPLLGGLRSYTLYKRIGLLTEYLREIESCVFTGNNKLVGWENYFQSKSLTSYKKQGISFSSIIFWLTLLAITIAAPAILVNQFPISDFMKQLLP